MTSGKTPRTALLTLLLAIPALLLAADLDLHSLLARVARPAADTIRFVDVRYSRLMKTPLAVAGTLERRPDGSLVRHVESPYRESTEIRGNDVLVEREGAKPRKFSLERAPELQVLLGSIGGMLRGDAELLVRSFAPVLEGSTERWQLRLMPNDARLRRRLSEVSVHGTDSVLRCFAMIQSTGDASIIVLGVDAPADVPYANRDELEAWCKSGHRP